MTFSKYIDEKCPCTKKNKELLADFGGYLLQHGWTYSEGVSNSIFTKGSIETGKISIIMPQKYHKNEQHRQVDIHYFRDTDQNKFGAERSRQIYFQIGALDTMVKVLNDFINLANSAT